MEIEEYDKKLQPKFKNIFLKQAPGIPKVENFIPIIRVSITCNIIIIET